MQKERPYVLSIAGLDPSAGAGLLADIKTFEQHGVYGLGICSAITLQTENKFFSVRWTETEELLQHVRTMIESYDVRVVKTGILPSFDVLGKIIAVIHEVNPETKIVVDPVIRSTTGFNFLENSSAEEMQNVLSKVSLLTPNEKEAVKLSGQPNGEAAGKFLLKFCPVIVKGMMVKGIQGVDILFAEGREIILLPKAETYFEKHGSGCVLSSSIAAHLALGDPLETACRNAKAYTEKFLAASTSLLGFHA